MATNHPGLTKVGSLWHYNLKINGHRAHGSTRATDLATAKKILEEKRRELLEGQHRIVSKVPTLSVVFADWLQNHENVLSAAHLGPFTCTYQKWIGPRLGHRLADRITAQDALQIRAAQAAVGCSQRYLNNTLIILKTLHNYAINTGRIRAEPLRVKPLRLQRKPKVVISATRLADFLAAVDKDAKSPHTPVMVRVMLGLGLREGEVRTMRWEWFDSERRTYVVGKAKGKEARVLPVPGWLWAILQALPKSSDEWVFPASDGQPHRSQVTKKILAKASAALALPGLTAHRLRASFASLHALAGTPGTEIQHLLGHKSLATTQIYLEQDQGARKRAQDKLWKMVGMDNSKRPLKCSKPNRTSKKP